MSMASRLCCSNGWQPSMASPSLSTLWFAKVRPCGGTIEQTASGAERFIAQVSLYSNTLGVVIAQNTYATDAGGEIAALCQLLNRVDLNGLLVQADALHANRPFSSTSSSVAPTS